MEFKVTLCADENLLSAINNLADALGGGKVTAIANADTTSLSDADIAKDVKDKEQYTMFQDLTKVAKKLQAADEETYETVLHQYVAKGKKYSAIAAADWGKATKDITKALKSLKAKHEEEEDEDENNDVIATEVKYFFDTEENAVGIIKKGATIPDSDTLDFLSKAEYLKKKKALEAAEDDFTEEDEEDTAPRLSVNEIRALASKASNAGVKVGALLNKVGGTKKVSELAEEKYNDFEDALNAAIEELEA